MRDILITVKIGLETETFRVHAANFEHAIEGIIELGYTRNEILCVREA
jgi:hypothetical protein